MILSYSCDLNRCFYLLAFDFLLLTLEWYGFGSLTANRGTDLASLLRKGVFSDDHFASGALFAVYCVDVNVGGAFCFRFHKSRGRNRRNL